MENPKATITLSNLRIVDGTIVADIEGLSGFVHIDRLHLDVNYEAAFDNLATLALTCADAQAGVALEINDVATGHVAHSFGYDAEPE